MLLSNRQLSGRVGDTQNTALFRIPNVGRNVMGSLLFLLKPRGRERASQWSGIPKRHMQKKRLLFHSFLLKGILPRATRTVFFWNHSFTLLICSIHLHRSMISKIKPPVLRQATFSNICGPKYDFFKLKITWPFVKLPTKQKNNVWLDGSYTLMEVKQATWWSVQVLLQSSEMFISTHDNNYTVVG